ncbi:hypothetical protein [Streptosporangium sp. NPDC049046]|uniref:hypothetical protein n=1 Tax=Streptosporangium sp. NPDC049046 TaxID=3155031 RepID=UPI00343EAB63
MAKIGHVHGLAAGIRMFTLSSVVDSGGDGGQHGRHGKLHGQRGSVGRLGVETAVLRGLVAYQDFATPYAIDL